MDSYQKPRVQFILDSARKAPRSCHGSYSQYEAFKSRLKELSLSPGEYELRCRELANILKV